MTRIPQKPVSNPPARLRQRQRANGAWRIWWEPEAAVRDLGFEPVLLDADRLTWSLRQAEKLNAQVAAARTAVSGGAAVPARAHGAATIKQVIAAYMASPRFQNLKPYTQKDYRAAFRLIEDKWGSQMATDFDKPAMVEWYETLYRTSGKFMAIALMRKFSVLFTYAESRGWCAQNPCLRLNMHVPTRRHRVASWAEVDALLDTAQHLGLASMAAAVALSCFMGQRQMDIVLARRADFDGKYWRLVRHKRGNFGALIIPATAKPYLRPMLAAHQDQACLLISESTGRAYTPDHFRHVWAALRTTATKSCPSLADLQFRDLRRSFGALARSGGASERDVADALGNKAFTDAELSQTYMPPSAETAARAIDAIKRPISTRKKGTGK